MAEDSRVLTRIYIVQRPPFLLDLDAGTQAAIEEIARAAYSGAKLVVFGHTHREAEDDRYANTGSFAFPRGAPGRPYLEIEGDAESPRAVRRYWPSVA